MLYISASNGAVRVLTVFLVVDRQDTEPPSPPVLGFASSIAPNPANGIPRGAVGIAVAAAGVDFLEVMVDGQLDQLVPAGVSTILLGSEIACSTSSADVLTSHEVSVVGVDSAGNRSAIATLHTAPN
ncbi:MAG: hypothetical protein Q8P18_22655 [Pseudomonadota bacterium]|nr:hypothetical protein [Pseudomonadota bacterium]